MKESLFRKVILRTASSFISTHLRSRCMNFLDKIYLGNLLKEFRINIVFDVGANQGDYVRMLRNLGYQGYIFSFEPNQADFMFLFKTFGRDPLWKGFNFALGSKNTKQAFNLTWGSVCNSFLIPKYGPVAGLIQVEVKRLDSIFNSLLEAIRDPRVFLKVDTQGYDLEVVKGASGCIDRILGLQSEISVEPIYENMPHYLEALSYYESLGFKLMDLLIVNRTPHGGILEYDCVMGRIDRVSSDAKI